MTKPVGISLPSLLQALGIISQHCTSGLNATTPEIRYPTESMTDLLLYFLATVPVLKVKSKMALLRLAPALTATEATPLLGNRGLLSSRPPVRLASLQALDKMTTLFPPHTPRMTARLWIACADSIPEIQTLAQSVWQKFSFELPETFVDQLIDLLNHPESTVRTSTAQAMANGLGVFPDQTQTVAQRLIELYQESEDVKIQNEFRRETEIIRKWPTRSGVALCLDRCAELFEKDSLLEIFLFLTSKGLAESEEEVWQQLLKAGLRMLEKHGEKHLSVLLPVFEAVLAREDQGTEELDRIREGAVLFTGTIAQHLVSDGSPQAGAKIVDVTKALVEALKTPSYEVQSAVSQCLAPLMTHSAAEKEGGAFVGLLLDRLGDESSYGQRMGAAFGLAGMIKGLKVSALKQYNVMDRLNEYISSPSAAKRQGALMAWERLFATLGMSFEPYVVQILPHLLSSFSDSDSGVRKVTQSAARTVMANLTALGIKMVLPHILRSLDDNPKWRTKMESIRMLGSMAFCAPQQLSTALPIIVPRLLEVLADPHSKIQQSGEQALRDIGSVIKNPEISELVPTLLKSLVNPQEHTSNVLNELLHTSFVNSIDAPSLALIVPILKNGLRDRTGSVKKVAAQIIGSMCSLISDVSDIMPYATDLLAGVKMILVDPLPEVRSAAARALGQLYKGIGTRLDEQEEETLEDWLGNLLKTDTSKAQRSGLAQGLSEVLAAIGTERLEEFLPELMENCSHENPKVREGYLQVLVFLPRAFGDAFSDYLEEILPLILSGLSDDKEPVREVSLQAGQVVVFMFGRTHTLALLRMLESGLFDSNARIREASVELVGDLLHGLAGRLMTSAGESLFDIEATDEIERSILDALGVTQRDATLSALYIARCDTAPNVRQIAFFVWKSVVVNTPRMVTRILGVLMETLVHALASESAERRESAGAAIEDLVASSGEMALARIVPNLEKGLDDERATTRQGVCLGISRVLGAAPRGWLDGYLPLMVKLIQKGLCDEHPSVRDAAAQAFETLAGLTAIKAVDEIVPALINEMKLDASLVASEDSTVEGLSRILGVLGRSKMGTGMALRHVVPMLAGTPVDEPRLAVLAALAPKFGTDVARWMDKLMKSVVAGLVAAEPEEKEEETKNETLWSFASELVARGVNSGAVFPFVSFLFEQIRTRGDDSKVLVVCGSLLSQFCQHTEVDFSADTPLILQSIFQLYSSQDPRVLSCGLSALTETVKTIDKNDQPQHISFLRGVISGLASTVAAGGLGAEAAAAKDEAAKPDAAKTAAATAVMIPGFCQPKGLAPLVPFFQEGLLHGKVDEREQAALAFGDLVRHTTADALKPFILKITGPLIRVVGDRFPPAVKSAILETLGLLLAKASKNLKAFLPQLQTTFVKALYDDSLEVREHGAKNLGMLMQLSPRVDSLVNELNSAARTKPDASVRASVLSALLSVVENVGEKISALVLDKVAETAVEFLDADEDEVRESAARLVGPVAAVVEDEKFDDLVDGTCLEDDADWRVRHAHLIALRSVMECDRALGRAAGVFMDSICEYVTRHAGDGHATVRATAGEVVFVAARALMAAQKRGVNLGIDETEIGALVKAGVALLEDGMALVKQGVCERLGEFARAEPDWIEEHMWSTPLVSKLADMGKNEKNLPLKTAAVEALKWVLQLGGKTREGIERFGKISGDADLVNDLMALARRYRLGI